MILLLGASGYVGQRYQKYLTYKNIPFQTASLRWDNRDLRGVSWLSDTPPKIHASFTQTYIKILLETHKPDFVINCAGYVGVPNVDACEYDKLACYLANALLPEQIAKQCEANGIKYGHVSTGCIFSGDENYPEWISPNFDESFYSKSKLWGEKNLIPYQKGYIWRLRLPFDHIDHPKNFISKIIKFNKLTNQYNSISNLNDFVRATVDSYLQEVPYGTYNVTNPGKIRAQDIAKLLVDKKITPYKQWEILTESEDISKIEKVKRSNCTLDSSKLINVGIPLQTVQESLNRTIDIWNKNIEYW